MYTCILTKLNFLETHEDDVGAPVVHPYTHTSIVEGISLIGYAYTSVMGPGHAGNSVYTAH
jgi:hypothetical protein